MLLHFPPILKVGAIRVFIVIHRLRLTGVFIEDLFLNIFCEALTFWFGSFGSTNVIKLNEALNVFRIVASVSPLVLDSLNLGLHWFRSLKFL
jgi:hypothetical protein